MYIDDVLCINNPEFENYPGQIYPVAWDQRHDREQYLDLLLSIVRDGHFYLGIESHFVGVHGPYELHRKEKQIKCTALAVHENLLFFPMQFIWPVNTDKMRFNTYIYIF